MPKRYKGDWKVGGNFIHNSDHLGVILAKRGTLLSPEIEKMKTHVVPDHRTFNLI
jgi:hypothetical protein